jgi:hypothetical protein
MFKRLTVEGGRAAKLTCGEGRARRRRSIACDGVSRRWAGQRRPTTRAPDAATSTADMAIDRSEQRRVGRSFSGGPADWSLSWCGWWPLDLSGARETGGSVAPRLTPSGLYIRQPTTLGSGDWCCAASEMLAGKKAMAFCGQSFYQLKCMQKEDYNFTTVQNV